MKPLNNFDATRNMSQLLTLRMQEYLTPVVNDVVGRAKTLQDQNVYFAVHDGLIEGLSADLGNVRYSAYMHRKYEYTTGYKHAKLNNLPTDNIAPFTLEGDVEIGLTINTEAFGQLRAVVRIPYNADKVNSSAIKFDLEGSIGTLWFNLARTVVDAVKLAGPLAAPQYKETLVAW